MDALSPATVKPVFMDNLLIQHLSPLESRSSLPTHLFEFEASPATPLLERVASICNGRPSNQVGKEDPHESLLADLRERIVRVFDEGGGTRQ
jgi:hypothetical protein